MYYEKLKEKLKKCSGLRIPITRHDRYKYNDLAIQHPQEFNRNATKLFFDQMKNHIWNGKVWRINCSGKTRHGKSEVAQTWTMLYIDEFNNALKSGAYKELEAQGVVYKQETLKKLCVDSILFSQSNYLYTLRQKEKEDDLIYGRSWIIDEDEESIGGVGSYSERLEIKNLNNITAQALQSEWQLRPDKFVLSNSPFGLFQEKMDRVNKVNWSMLYEFKSDPTRTKDYVFIGWVATPLHDDQEFRIKYNEKKKENIKKVYQGSADLRLIERVRVAEILARNELFATLSTNEKTFKLSRQQQESILNEMVMDREVQNFNSVEKSEIIEHARMIIMKEIIQREKLERGIEQNETKKPK